MRKTKPRARKTVAICKDIWEVLEQARLQTQVERAQSISARSWADEIVLAGLQAKGYEIAEE
jgi:hypothetical protein